MYMQFYPASNDSAVELDTLWSFYEYGWQKNDVWDDWQQQNEVKEVAVFKVLAAFFLYVMINGKFGPPVTILWIE